jgi:hypothetical protein
MIAKPSQIAPAVAEPSDRLLTGVCSRCSYEDPFTHSGACPKACGGSLVARDDTPAPSAPHVQTWAEFLDAASSAARAEDEADERKEWREDDQWNLGAPRR